MIFNNKIPVEPQKCLSIQGIDGYETYKIDEITIGVRPKWISVKDRLPEYNEDVLVNDGGKVYSAHWSITKDWVCSCKCYEGSYLDNVTHWIPPHNIPKE